MRQEIKFTEEVRGLARRVTDLGVSALGELFDRTSQRLVRYAVSVTQNQHDAEDAVQAVLVRVASNPRRLSDADCVWSYLLQMVRNESLGIVRRRKRCVPSDQLIDLRTRCRVDELAREETYRKIWTALRRLPTDQAEVVVLKVWESMTFAQIARIVEISPNTAASRFQYAMTKLEQSLRSVQEEIWHE